ncbi:MAG: four-carbon acid sugar kinase family protein [Burkholderiaceae bacterium]|nr:four-carbon acid sugar kinase family protein [Burkholderiaceae bacterium]
MKTTPSLKQAVLGVIADDFTGATDVAGMLVQAGMDTLLTIGVPEVGAAVDADAVVVALKSRTVAPAEAVRDSLAALDRLRAAGCRRYYFKVCSTFDSTPRGNIGPVAQALMAALNADFAIACPAFPENGRSVYCGHLFVGDLLLSDSGMKHHPLTPMTDANLVRWLQAQTALQVGLLRRDAVAAGVDAVASRIAALRTANVRIAIADAIDNADLRTLGAACADLPLLIAGSGLALGLPAAYVARGWMLPDAQAAPLPAVGGHAAVLSGSCSTASNAQVAHWLQSGRPALPIDALQLAAGAPVAAQALAWAEARLAQGPVLVYATAGADAVKAAQQQLGVERAGALIEDCLAEIATGLHERGVRRLVVAGGETSGAVVQALRVQRLRVGAPIDPGVPWTQAEGRPLLLALKSGNFGSIDFFAKALASVQ